MMREYNVVFKLPCEKTFTFDILVCNDGYDPTTEVGNYPSKYMLDYFLLYVPQLQDYSGSEISNGTVVSVQQKINAYTRIPSPDPSDAETDSEHKEEPLPSLKSLYWKNGYIVKTRGNGFGIVSNDVIFCNAGTIHKSNLDDSLISNPINCPSNANDIIEVWDNTATRPFNPYSTAEVRRYCRLVWSRFVEMSIEEIERKLNLPKGTLVIKD